ncbi:MAG: methyltransferase domain-containing protein [Alphaproteobacteria bacterium]|nr:methyltransferase domain-containing protein [Alphaproteobacteria bacterium]HPF46121.1 methyltransferase domain-containing protein [Emcibacteraceae bacterium]
MTQKKFKFKASNESDLFNRSLIRLRRDKISTTFANHDFLKKEISHRLVDNLGDIKKSFDIILNLNVDESCLTRRFKQAFIISQDLSLNMLKNVSGISIQADEEYLPYKNQGLELVLSCLNLHWVNDLPGTLIQILRSLKPDGLFLGAIFGGETLTELRQSMLKADIELRGGTSPHISPFIDVRDAGSLLQRAGFALPVVSTERITVTYSDALGLMKELKAMGENNALIKQYKGLTSPRLMVKTAEIYHQSYANKDGRVPATFDIVYLQGWAPHESQQKPLKPGTAKISLKEALGTNTKKL